MRITEFKPDFDDVLIRPKRSFASSRADIYLTRHFKHITMEGIPIINANMDTVGSLKMADAMGALGYFSCIHKHYPMDQLREYYGNAYEDGKPHRAETFYTMGIKPDDFIKFDDIYNYSLERRCGISCVCLDVANGHTQDFEDAVKRLRDNYEVIIMAGNVATPESTESLIMAGANIVKVGIGPGSVCTTRVKTGVGYPQLSAISECADAAHGLSAYICGDGGCRTPGDVCKAFCAGADIVMLGGMLAGCDECDGEWAYDEKRYWYAPHCIDGFTYDGMNTQTGAYSANICTHDKSKDGIIIEKIKTSLKYYGMSSKDAADKYHGGVASHRTAEGKAVYIPYKGPVLDTLRDIEGGLRSCGAYIGATQIKDFPKCATFVRTNTQENKVFNQCSI